MNIAYTAEYQIIEAKNANKGRKYFCPVCNGELHFFPGKTNAPHFRHSKGVSNEVKDRCELYSRNFVDITVYREEIAAQQKVRIVVVKQKDEYLFRLKFPLLKKENVKMQLKNLYFSYTCEQLENFNLNIINLLPARNMNEHEAPLMETYSFSASNEKYEKQLGLKISGEFNPFEDGPLIFKQIQNQYVNLPYRKVILSGRFFIASKRPLSSIHEELFLVDTTKIEQLFLYEFNMPISFTSSLQRWFMEKINYSLVRATCHLDIISPLNFKKIGNTIEITASQSIWKLTNIGERSVDQRLIVIHPNNKREVIKVPPDNKIQVNLHKHGDYLIYLDQEITDFITIRYIPRIKYENNYFGNLMVNDNDVLFKLRNLEADDVKLSSELRMLLYSHLEMFYEISTNSTVKFNSPIRIDIPRLWSFSVKKSVEKNEKEIFNKLLSVYEERYLYPKTICDVKSLNMLIQIVIESEFENKGRLLFLIRRLGLHVPRPVIKIVVEIMGG